ncbi:MAG: metal-dependent hydrolase [gamma proteobacterium endosymbiont of Lamellibrachia anaximandri]|nr:metal-dependent hydrolase [gamma proteobacterium endosymbiont of Lamellibrachia anaximandri]
MDLVTHVLLGAVCAGAVTAQTVNAQKELRLRMTVTAVAAVFPDIDYLSFWLDPLVFLADWHRTATHSFLLMPVWAGLLGSLFMLFRPARARWRSVYGLCALGITTHLLLDLMTVFGIRIFYPASEAHYSFGTTFIIDLITTSILAVVLFHFLRRHRRSVALSGMALIIMYWGIQWVLKTQAHTIAADQVTVAAHVYALPQPFSPFYWKLIRRSEDSYEVAYLSLLADETGLLTLYRGPKALHWRQYSLLGSNIGLHSMVREAWQHHRFNKFRSFAQFPVLYRVDQEESTTCVWFTDMRYTLPFIQPAFRYGMCKNIDSPWHLYRLKRFTDNERQLLPEAELSLD